MFRHLRLERGDKAFSLDEDEEYLRHENGETHGPVQFDWNERQLKDLETLFLGKNSDGARHRMARDLGQFME